MRYEVWRVFEGALATPNSVSHEELRQLAQQHPEKFEKRTDQAFAPQYQDRVPGRAPTRVLYQVRSVGLNDEVGAPSDVIGPFAVPDVRQPSAPNLVKVVSRDPRQHSPSISLAWNQPGPKNQLTFEVFVREEDWVLLTTLANPQPDALGRYGYVHEQLSPGKRYGYRVRAVRVTEDPTRPGQTRGIKGPFSRSADALAVTLAPLKQPSSLSHSTQGRTVSLVWSNQDMYEHIEVKRRTMSGVVFRPVVSLEGTLDSYHDTLEAPGDYAYRIVCYARNKKTNPVESETITIQ